MRWLWTQLGKGLFWLSWPVLFMAAYFSTRTRVIVEHRDKILLVKPWLGSGTWILPGGGLRWGEPRLTGARREVQEETGIRLNPSQLTLLTERRLRENSLPSRFIVYVAAVAERPAVRRRRWELTDVRWFSADDILERGNVSQGSQQALRSWRQHKKLVK